QKRLRHGEYGMADPQLSRHKVQAWVDNKAVHFDVDHAVGRARKNKARWQDHRLPDGLPQRHRGPDHDSSSSYAHVWDTELHRPTGLLSKGEPRSLQRERLRQEANKRRPVV